MTQGGQSCTISNSRHCTTSVIIFGTSRSTTLVTNSQNRLLSSGTGARPTGTLMLMLRRLCPLMPLTFIPGAGGVMLRTMRHNLHDQFGVIFRCYSREFSQEGYGRPKLIVAVIGPAGHARHLDAVLDDPE